MDLLIITGISGAGKTQVVHALEDIGYFCIDNIPAMLIAQFLELVKKAGGHEKVAVVTDLRAGKLFNDFFDCITALKSSGIDYKILYLYANEETIARRYSESRRKHPLRDEEGSTIKAIQREMEIMKPVSTLADYHLDTSLLTSAELKSRIVSLFGGDVIENTMLISCVSFGFKNGIPSDTDLLFDVRHLPNPFYEPSMRERTGLEQDVFDYVMTPEVTQKYLKLVKDLLEYSIPLYIKEGKSQLVIGFGCTGGHHRSVAMAEEINRFVKSLGYNSRSLHRDIGKAY